MENTSYVGLSYQIALERKMDLIANNVANVDTNGYKSSHITFLEQIEKPKNDKPLSMVLDYGNYKNFEQGGFQETGNSLDVALEGNGFIAIQTADGEKFTRNGTFSKDNRGQLVTSSGDIVMDAGSKPIIIPENATQVTIAEDGSISTEEGEIGRLKIVSFNKPQDIRPVGNNLFETDQAANPDKTTKVFQGMVERSNVNAVTEMTDMIEVMRKYQSIANMLKSDHDLQRTMIQQFSRV